MRRRPAALYGASVLCSVSQPGAARCAQREWRTRSCRCGGSVRRRRGARWRPRCRVPAARRRQRRLAAGGQRARQLRQAPEAPVIVDEKAEKRLVENVLGIAGLAPGLGLRCMGSLSSCAGPRAVTAAPGPICWWAKARRRQSGWTKHRGFRRSVALSIGRLLMAAGYRAHGRHNRSLPWCSYAALLQSAA